MIFGRPEYFMRILLLNTFPVWGGDEKWTLNVALGLQDRGHHVVVSSATRTELTKRAREHGLVVFPFNIGPDIALWKVPSFVRYLKRNAVEAVICVQNRDVKIGALAARIAGIRAIFARSGLDTMKNKFYHKVAFTRYIDGIIVNTKSLKTLYEGYGWFEDDFVRVVYDGLEVPEQYRKIDLHEAFGLSPGSRVIMGTGRLSKQKRFDLLIHVAALAKKNGKNWSIVIAGTGDLLSSLRRMARELNVEDMVHFIGFRDDVMDILYASDVFVLSSDSEGMSNALREAMAVGKACVATNVYGVSELFQDGNCGIMVSKGDAGAIYDAVQGILTDAEWRRSLEHNAVEHIKTSFSLKSMIDDVEGILYEQLSRNSI
jgi:glycosyltransferase involved in cell wall biosynthesis